MHNVSSIFTNPKRCLIFAGHYGSGKTNVAVNVSLKLAENGHAVTIADLDTVNPYFRTADALPILEQAGIKAVIPEFANSNVDIPALPSDMHRLFTNSGVSIIDVGGDEGATALGVFHKDIERVGYDMLYVVNMYRPLTQTPSEAFELMRDIESCARLKFTGIVNNSNLGELTDTTVVEQSEKYADEICRLSELPLILTSVINSYVSDEKKDGMFIMSGVTKKLF